MCIRDRYHSHAATIYKWAQEDAAKGKAAPKQGIPDYSCKEGESLDVYKRQGVWPVNEYTEGLPVPSGTVGWAMLDTEHEHCSIRIVDISETDYNDYLELLKQEGFALFGFVISTLR